MYYKRTGLLNTEISTHVTIYSLWKPENRMIKMLYNGCAVIYKLENIILSAHKTQGDFRSHFSGKNTSYRFGNTELPHLDLPSIPVTGAVCYVERNGVLLNWDVTASSNSVPFLAKKRRILSAERSHKCRKGSSDSICIVLERT